MPKSKKTAVARSKPVALEAKIVVLKAENPFREGTKVYKRVQAVLLSKGKPVEVALKKGARRSTMNWLRDHKIIRFAA